MLLTFASQLDRAEFASLNLCHTSDGWQASLETERGAFRIRVGATPSEALAALFEVGGAVLPPNPPPLPY